MHGSDSSDFDRLWIAAGKKNKEKQYWIQKLSGELTKSGFPYLHFPEDSLTETSDDIRVTIPLDENASSRLMKLSGDSDIRLHIVLSAVLTLLLAKYTGNEDIIIGTAVSHGAHGGHGVIGTAVSHGAHGEHGVKGKESEFINTVLALRNQLNDAISFKELLYQVRQTLVEADEHQNYPFEVLVRQLDVTCSENECPLFDVALVLENIQDKRFIAKVNPKIIFSFLRVSEAIEGKIDYNSHFYHRRMIERLAIHFHRIVDIVLSDPEIKLSEIDMLTGEEKNRLLYDFNHTEKDYPKDKTIHELFEEQVEKTPDHLALVGLTAVGADPRVCPQLSYNELNNQSGRLTNELMQRGIKTDTIIAIKIPRSLEMIIGILGILKAGGAYLPIDPDYPQERVDYMLKDSGAELLLTSDNEEVEKIRSSEGKKVLFLDPLNLSVSSAGAHTGAPLHGEIRVGAAPCVCPSASFLPSTVNRQPATSLAYIIYTSGSTGNPKGVLVNHQNVIRLVKHTNFIDFQSEDRILQTGALAFDASTFEIWGSLLNGLTLHLIDKNDVLNPETLKASIIENKITIMWMTSPLFNQMVQSDEAIFGSLRCLLVGGDVLSPSSINRIKSRFPALTIVNGYGPTENTTFSTTFRIDKLYEEKIPIGKPIANSTAYIVNTHGRLQPLGVGGELWVGGNGISRGYLNNPELTAEKFISVPSVSPVRNRLYRTGDLARWLEDGNIEFLGRIDSQVKIRGFRVELSEIENRLLKYPPIKEAVVIVKEDKRGGKYLCSYVVFNDTIDPVEISRVREYLLNYFPDYMIPSHFIQVETIPLTSNGKIDWRALPEVTVRHPERPFETPRDDVEKTLAEIWGEVLGFETRNIGIDDDFFELGGHSLKAALFIAKLHKELDVNLSLTQMFTLPTIRGLSDYIKKSAKNRYAAIAPVEKKEYYALSSAQKRLYVLHRMDPEGIHYNIPSFFELIGEIDKNRLEQTFKRLIDRHESFRTSFHMIDDEPVQRINGDVKFELKFLTELTEDTEGEKKKVRSEEDEKVRKINCLVKYFDLTKAPLIRVGLLELEENKHLLAVDMHHIVSDGTSIGVVLHDFMAFYRGEDLPELRVQYKDFSDWQNREKQTESLTPQEVFWVNEFAGEIPVLDLSVDYPRPSIRSFEGRTVTFEIDQEAASGVNALALDTETTAYMVLLAIYNVFLSKLSGQEEIVIGSPVAGRRHADLEKIVGMFVNTLALRNHPTGEKTFTEFLNEVKERTLTIFENQDYPYEELVERVATNRDTGRNPLFDVMFILQNMTMRSLEIPGLKLSSYAYENKISKFDLTLSAIETECTFLFTFEYGTKLFKPETIERFILYFKNMIQAVIEHRNQRLSDFEIIPEEEKNRILYDFNNTEADYPKDKTIHGLFEEQVKKTPDRMALIGSTSVGALREAPLQMSYQELNERSGHLAHELLRKGVQPDTIVGIQVDRSIDMVIGILGILKAGGAYLPINPAYPQERIDYMLTDSQALFLVTYVGADPRVCPGTSSLAFSSVTSVGSVRNPSSLAYIIYTSGSTGKPKGVMVAHASAVNLLEAMQNRYPLGESDTYLLKTSYLFDVSVTELFGWCIGGGRLAVLEAGGEKDPGRIREAIQRHRVSHINFVPSMFHAFIDYLSLENENETENNDRLSSLKYIFLAGEALLPALVKKFDDWKRDLNTAVTLENIYGPTESTVYAAWYSLSRWNGTGSIPIGKPLPNIKLYIMNKYEYLQPGGLAGELCISGKGLARGYLNNPELTSEKFTGCQLPVAGSFNPTPKDSRTPNNTNTTHNKTKSFWSHLFSKRWAAGGNCYKTGDLCRWLDDGNIEFLGRIDRQVKVRGFRIELGEIENRLIRHPDIKMAVVVLRESLIAYFVSNEKIKETTLRDYLSTYLPGYMIPAYFIRLDQIPLLSNGKVDTRALPNPEIARQEHFTAPRDAVEQKLVEIWAAVLGIGEDKAGQISIDSNFFESGGHSLKAIRLMSLIHKEFNVAIPLAQIFNYPTVRKQAECINTAAKDLFLDIPTVEEKEYYDLSFIQKRIWVICQRNPQTSSYHIPSVIEMDHPVDAEKIKRTLQGLSHRHESLRTFFKQVESQPVQFITKKTEPLFQRIDLSSLPEDEKKQQRERLIAEEFTKPFDLAVPPLFRSTLIKMNPDHYTFLFIIHHIISDGASLDLLKRDFDRLLDNREIAEEWKSNPLPVSYKDFSHWFNHRFETGGFKEEAHHYWLEKIQSGFPPLELPTDFSNRKNDRKGSMFCCFASDQLKGDLEKLARKNKTSLFTILFSAFNLFLFHLTKQTDITSGIVSSGRDHFALQPIVGCFSNTIPLHIQMDMDTDHHFPDVLHHVNEEVFRALRYQNYPIEMALDELQLKYPDITVAVNMPGLEEGTKHTRLTSFTPYHLPDVQEVKFLLELYIIEFQNGIRLDWCYKSSVFLPETIAFFAHSLLKLLDVLCQNPKGEIPETNVFRVDSESIKRHFIRPTNDFEEFELQEIHQSIISRFESRVERYPDRLAVKHSTADKDSGYTYNELNAFSNCIANALIHPFGMRNNGVGLLFEHGAEMIAAMFGVLKSGNFYIPLDPTYPPSRLEYMLTDSGTPIILTNDANMDFAKKLVGDSRGIRLINIHNIERSQTKNPDIPIGLSDAAYILYTSGSTGTPKGVVQCHRNVLHFMRVYTNNLHIAADDRLTLFSSYSFDAAVMDIYGALLNGASVFPYNIKEMGKMDQLANWLGQEAITIYHSVPTVYRFFVDGLSTNDQFPSIRLIVLGGEEVLKKDVFKYNTHFSDDCLFINGLGPTESTVTLQNIIDKHTPIRKELVPVGFPVDRTQVYLLDENHREVDTLGVGEIVYGSDHLALGYLNKPEVTANAFRMNPLKGTGRVYRSGDFGKRLPDGSIEFIGRRDFQVKIRGYRVELSEIEGIMDKVEGIKKSIIACLKNDQDESFLAGYYVKNKAIDESAILKTLNASLPDYMVPRVLVNLEAFPLTPTGKIDRKALPQPDIAMGETYVGPGNDIEKTLTQIWGAALSKPADKIGIDDNFFDLGGHSLKATILTAKLHQTFEVDIPLAEVFKNPTIRELAHLIATSRRKQFIELAVSEDKAFYELSLNQKRLWYLHQMQSSGSAFHIPGRVILDHAVNEEWIEKTLAYLLRRHESIRTGFKTIGGQPVQYILTDFNRVSIPFEKIDLSSLDDESKHVQRENSYNDIFRLPFDLAQPPLFRALLLKLDAQRFELMFNMHHIITDGWSMEIIRNEFLTVYDSYRLGKESALDPLPFRYRDFSEWHNVQLSNREKMEESYRFWKRQLEKGLDAFTLPGDFPQNRKNQEGAGYTCFIDQNVAQQIKQVAKSHRMTLFTVMFTAYMMWLARFSGKQHIVSSIIGSGRPHPSLHSIVGFFVNSIIFNTEVDFNEPFIDFLKRMNQDVLDVFEHQDYNLESLLNELEMKYPEISISFNMLHIKESAASEEFNNIEPVHIDNFQETKFDLELYLTEYKNGIHIFWSYKKKLFKPETIVYMVNEYIKLLDFFTLHPTSTYVDYRKLTTKFQSFKKNKGK
ncbi:MAG: amino acid adenylation domain-containing protein [Candidatus Omnitrophota bacterium]